MQSNSCFKGALAFSLAFSLASPTARCLDEAGPGFKLLGMQPLPGTGSVHATLRTGERFQFDGQLCELYGRDGTLLATLADLGQMSFPSFALIDPSGSFAVIGENLTGELYRVELDGSGLSTIANAPFNYDADFDSIDPNFVWVSAATAGFGMGNDLLHVHLASGAVTLVAHVDNAASGPLEVDPVGDLLYADVPEDFCPEPGQTEVVKWTREQLLSGQVQSIGDASLLATGFDGGSSLELDPISGLVFLAENDFCAPAGRVVAVDFETSGRGDLLGQSLNFLSNLEVKAGPGDASLQAYQPSNARLTYTSTDFSNSVADVVTVVPRRARMTLEPPSSYPGIVSIHIEDAAPKGGVRLLWAGSHFYDGSETAFDLGFGFPTFFAAALNRLRRMPFPLATDAEGGVTYRYFDDGSLVGNFVLQGIVLSGSGRTLGTTTPVLN